MSKAIDSMSIAILSVAENKALTKEQKLEVIAGILTELSKSSMQIEQYKFKNLLEYISKKCSSNEASNKITSNDMNGLFGIFFPDNSFTVAKFRTSDYTCAGHPSYYRYSSSLIDIVTGAKIESYVNGRYESRKSPLRYSEQGVTTLNDGHQAYFIALKNLTSLVEYPTADRDEFIKEIIKVVNTYLDEHPPFVNHTVFKGR